jgi:predicted AAA+ superfamily ATPase
MVGRKRLFELTTVSFEEFVGYRTGDRYEGNLLDFLEIEKEKTILLLMEYLQYGGYPRIVMATEQREKLQLMDEIYRSQIQASREDRDSGITEKLYFKIPTRKRLYHQSQPPGYCPDR